ncbi:hypothetical protein [Thermomonospora cellulosilytica]|uniref:Uncharacterized protein n=1 Tax=Thermomonospora cellulosilytica TaxID=1411118 RepID=A0A7W3MU86_9ACTN|nr:hypothetical protein [Thermomonospora cellulosilytica]MBA9001969.1 hypothetical protein [Thermomonospora cellulosilytica]
MSAVFALPVLHIERISPHLDFQITDEGGNVVARVDQTSGPRPGWWKRNVFGMVDNSPAVTLGASSVDGTSLFSLHRDASEGRGEGQTTCRLLGASGDPLGHLERQKDEYVGASATLPSAPRQTVVRRYRLYGSDGRVVGEAVSAPIEMVYREGGESISTTGDFYTINDASGQEVARLEGTRLGEPNKRFTLRIRPGLPADLRLFVLAVPFAMKLV